MVDTIYYCYSLTRHQITTNIRYFFLAIHDTFIFIFIIIIHLFFSFAVTCSMFRSYIFYTWCRSIFLTLSGSRVNLSTNNSRKWLLLGTLRPTTSTTLFPFFFCPCINNSDFLFSTLLLLLLSSNQPIRN